MVYPMSQASQTSTGRYAETIAGEGALESDEPPQLPTRSTAPGLRFCESTQLTIHLQTSMLSKLLADENFEYVTHKTSTDLDLMAGRQSNVCCSGLLLLESSLSLPTIYTEHDLNIE
jgi:hypothetical protein